MSVRDSSNNAPAAAIAPFTRWPGLLRLALDVLGGPIIALINQQVIYAGDMWACGYSAKESLHLGAVLCLVGAIAVTVDSYFVWRATGGGMEEERDAQASRTRFFALLGLMIGAISTFVVLAQWLAIFMFGACMRA